MRAGNENLAGYIGPTDGGDRSSGGTLGKTSSGSLAADAQHASFLYLIALENPPQSLDLTLIRWDSW